MVKFQVRRTQGKTWAVLTSGDFVTRKFLQKVGRLLVKAIVFEGRKDLARQGNQRTPRGVPEGLPVCEKDDFFKSFYFRVEGQGVSVYSRWPQIEQLTEGRRAYPMKWLTREAGVNVVPIEQDDGTVVLRTTPRLKEDAWIHPGFRKHNFIRRGYERARRQMDALIQEQIVETLKGTNVV